MIVAILSAIVAIAVTGLAWRLVIEHDRTKLAIERFNDYGLDDRLRDEPEDPTDMFIRDMDQKLRDEEQKTIQRVVRRGQFNHIL